MPTSEQFKNYKLYYNTICPYSRTVKIILLEKQLSFSLINKDYWNIDKSFMKLNPALNLPVLIDNLDNIFADFYPILEYLNDLDIGDNLIGQTFLERAETRRLISWFGFKFYNEVVKYIINEKIIKFIIKRTEPNSQLIRVAKYNLDINLNYLKFLLDKNRWIAGEKFSAVDIITAAMISILDYLDEINWEKYPNIKDWYCLVKSRPSFQELLEEEVQGYKPSKQYTMLDF